VSHMIVRLSPTASGLELAWRSGGCFASVIGAVRTKKWKPFHHMYRANYLREMYRQQAEAQARAEEAAASGLAVPAEVKMLIKEPTVATTPFQATRLMRALDVFPQPNDNVQLLAKLNVDLTRESVRGTCHLPHGLKTKLKVLAFCPDHDAKEMIEAGADFAGITDISRRIQTGWLGFDRCIATPAIMPQVMKLAKVLGPRKMMPNPRSGTVVQNLKAAITESKSGTLLEYRAEGEGDLKLTIANNDFSDAQILDNMKFIVNTLLRSRPRSGGSTMTSMPGKPPSTSLIPGKESTTDRDKDQYFLEAKLQLGLSGPHINVDTDTILPTSVGYFR